MSAENKALVRRWFEELNKGKAAALAAMDEIFATDLVFHSATGADIHGIKDFKQNFSNFFSAFPDLHFPIDDIVIEGDKIAVRFTTTGTLTAQFHGVPPTNKKMMIWAITIYHIAGGKIVEGWGREDTLGMMQQLGIIPTPKKEK